jgi:hypothetical protein
LAGLVVAIAGFSDLLGGFADKIARGNIIREKLLGLLARSNHLTLQELDGEMARIEAVDCGEVESLRVVAFNDNARSNGHEDWVRPESRLQRLMPCLA